MGGVRVRRNNKYDYKILTELTAGMFTFDFLYRKTDIFRKSNNELIRETNAYRRLRQLAKGRYIISDSYGEITEGKVYRLYKKGFDALVNDFKVKYYEIRSVHVSEDALRHELLVSYAWRATKIYLDKSIKNPEIQYIMLPENFLKQNSNNVKGSCFPDFRLIIRYPGNEGREKMIFDIEIDAGSIDRNKIVKKITRMKHITLFVHSIDSRKEGIQTKLANSHSEISKGKTFFALHSDFTHPRKGIFSDPSIWENCYCHKENIFEL